MNRVVDRLTNEWALKLTSFVLAFVLWTTVRADAPGQWQATVAVRVANQDGDWVIGTVQPESISVTFRGPYRELHRASLDRPYFNIAISNVSDSLADYTLTRNLMRMPPGTENTEFGNFTPNSVSVTFDRIAVRLIPLAVQLRGSPAAGFELLTPPEIEPSVVRASGPSRRLSMVDSLRLPVIDLSGRTRRDTLDVSIDTTGTGLIISPRTVRVILPLQPATDSALLPLRGERPRGSGG